MLVIEADLRLSNPAAAAAITSRNLTSKINGPPEGGPFDFSEN
jgi:hypothetical protein